jgi:predicted metal-dependent peptidase
MVYNPEFMEKLTDKEKLGVLMHEFYHIIFEHVTTRLPPEGMNMMWNVATDLAINSHISDMLPEGGCIPEKAGTPFEKYPAGLSAEAYYEMLKEDEQFKPKDGEDGQGSSGGSGGESLEDHAFDDHSGWGDVDGETKQIAQEHLKEAVKKAAEEASKGKGWGTVSSDVRKQIMDMITPKVDWRKVLRYFIKKSQRADKRSTVRRINKRFPLIHAGKKVRRQAAEFTIIPFDTEVDPSLVYTWKKGESRAWERVKCGGTCFNAPTKYVNDQRKFDGHIIMSDMEAPKPIRSHCQRMWFTNLQGKENPYFKTNELVIAIDES